MADDNTDAQIEKVSPQDSKATEQGVVASDVENEMKENASIQPSAEAEPLDDDAFSEPLRDNTATNEENEEKDQIEESKEANEISNVETAKADAAALFGESDDESESESDDEIVAVKRPKVSDSSSSDESVEQIAKKKRRLSKGAKETAKSGTKKKKARRPVQLKTKSKGRKDDFIDSEEDNPELAKTYETQKEYDSDADPYDDEEEGKQKKPETNNEDDFDKVLKKLSSRGKKKGDGMTDDEREGFVHDCLLQMDKAAEDDIKARKEGKPALYKLRILDEVLSNLSKRHLQTIFLERNLLQVLGQWLRPSPVDGALPALSIRNKIIDLLPQLQIESDHLRRGKFGRVVSYLKDCPKETPENRKKLRKLMQNWARNVFGKTDNYRLLEEMQTQQGIPEISRPSETPAKAKETKVAMGFENILSKSKPDTSEPAGSSRYRAKIPPQRSFNFISRPIEKISISAAAKKDSKTSSSKKALEKKIKLRKPRR